MSNVASSSAGVPVISSSDLPTVEEVKGYSAEKLNEFLKGRLSNIDNHINTLTAQEVDGDAFLDLTHEGLKAYGISLGASTKIVKLINDIQGGKGTSFSLTVSYSRILTYSCAFLSCFLSSNPPKKHIRVIVEQPGAEHPTKKRRIEQGWKSYKASDGPVDLPSKIIDMLQSNKFVPESRDSFKTAFQNLNVGRPITLPHLGQEPKHFAKNYQGRTLFVTKQMIDIWGDLSKITENSIKFILSGPMGVGKSYISYFLASKAYAEGWIVLYIADASDLNVQTSAEAGEVICEYFLALNKDILTATNLDWIVRQADYSSNEVEIAVAHNILKFLKTSKSKNLLIVDEHGALFESNPPVPQRLHVLHPLMSLNYWGEHFKGVCGVCVIFTGTAHAKYERVYVQNGHRQEVMILVGPIQSDVFDELLKLHHVLREPSIKEEVKRVTNCVPRELVYLVKYIDSSEITTVNIREALKVFEDERIDEMLHLAQTYFNSLQKIEQNRYYNSLTSMFLPNKPIVQFGWKFLDLGLVYRYMEGTITHYLPLCPSARKALLKMYTSFELPENIKYQLSIKVLGGDEFEEALFTRLASRCNTTIQLNATDINNKNRRIVTLQFDDYGIIKPPGLSLGPGFDRVLGRGFDKYPRFDYMLGPIFMQVSVSNFVSHNQESADIKKAFEIMSPQTGISQMQIDGRNQIEMYLDEMYGTGHSAKINSMTNKFIVTKNSRPVPGFRIVYIRGSPGIPNHYRKVKEFPDVAHVTFEEITSQLFRNIV